MSQINHRRRLSLAIPLVCLLSLTGCAQMISSEKLKDTSPSANIESLPSAIPQSAIRNPQSQDPHPVDPGKFALIIGGISGEEGYARQFSRWSENLRSALTDRLNFAPAQVTVLNEKGSAGATKATAEEVKKAFAALKASARADSKVFIFLIGHGTFDGKISKFNLTGPDLTAEEYAALIKALPTRQVVVINSSSASGEFIKPLSAQGRVIITATRSGMEQNATRFAEYFVAALSGKPPESDKEEVKADAEVSRSSSGEADLDKNGRVSVLEAFDYASKLVNGFYEQQGRLVTEHALLDDNGDGKGHPKAEAGDGALAKVTYFDSLPQVQAGGDAELAKMLSEKTRLENEIEQLKARKEQLKAEAYEAALEKLLLDLAQLNQQIRAKQNR